MKMNIYFISLLFFFLASCGKETKSEFTEEKPLVVTTIGPYKFLLDELAGKYIEALNLSENSGDPHTLQLRPQESVQLKHAALFLSLNPVEEDLVLKALGTETKIAEMWQGFPLLGSQHHHDEHQDQHQNEYENEHYNEASWDEHFWLDPVALQVQLATMAEELIALLPDRAEQIQKNKDGLLQRCRQLAEQLRSEVPQLQGGKILSFHSALAYFAAFFNAEELYIEAQGMELGSQEILQLSEASKDLTFPVLIYSPQFQKDTATALGKQMNLALVEFDPQEPNIFESLENLAKQLAAYGSK